MKAACSPKAAFTLIELLVVVSIIALLIALLMPALRAARLSAQSIKSLSQLRQIGIAAHLYANDYRNYLPYNRARSRTQDATNAVGTPVGAYWNATLFHGRYVSSIETFYSPGHDRCPSILFPSAFKTNNEHWEWRMLDYAVNYTGAMPDQIAPNTKTFRVGSIKPPADKHLMLLEAVRGADWGMTGSVPFTFRGVLTRIYMDGHGANRDGADLGWIGTDGFSGAWVPGPAPHFNSFFRAPWYVLDLEYYW